jgi:hypothetical protein
LWFCKGIPPHEVFINTFKDKLVKINLDKNLFESTRLVLDIMVSPLFNGYFNCQSLLENDEVIRQVHPLSYRAKCEKYLPKGRARMIHLGLSVEM